ncbi:sensor histidine kinase [Ileibacterium valens]|uniref:sensor histidine kinase n=1 Tax=Ileibacterium valens TaxID=1862668 RepID=UPI00259BCE75|nr:HAMP domain-containing sensor histidine kinase [Ileibacterium valens]
MKQLKKKIVLVLGSLLSVLGILIFGIVLFMEGMKAEDEIRTTLLRVSSSMNSLYDGYLEGKPYFYNDGPQSERRGSLKMDDDFSLITDDPVFTFQIDNHRIWNILYLNADMDEISEALERADWVLAHDEPSKAKTQLSLLGDRYAWYYPDLNSMTLIDIHSWQDDYVDYFWLCTGFFIVYLLAVWGIAQLISKWLIRPVAESFEKQKQFIADASHELKTPLAVILSSAEAMERNPDNKWLKNIETETDRMNRLIGDLLELTRSEQIKLPLSRVNLSFIAEKECLNQEARIYEKGLTLNVDIEPDVEVIGNADSLSQVLGILLDNAISHARSEIRIKVRKQGSQSICFVENNGRPIPLEMQKRIFERFVREDTSRNRSDNRFGLGLAIAKNLMNQNQGTIKVQTVEGWTVFSFILKTAH